MRRSELERFLLQSLDDDRLSRGERQVLQALLAELDPDTHEQQVLLHRAFALAAERLFDGRDRVLVDWLEEVVKVLRPTQETAAGGGAERVAEAWFTPSRRAIGRLRGLMANCRHRLDVCVFTITHDDLAEELLMAQRRKVAVRILTDDEKSHDLGSDVHRLERAGIEVRMDDSPAHMHNKFVVLDERLLVTGSFNWTRSAATANQESFIVTDEPALVGAHLEEFERLWAQFASG